LEQPLIASLDLRLRKRLGLPHPLDKFAANGVKDNVYADSILEFLNDWTFAEPDTMRSKGARWFLFESERAFPFACSECGINADKFREHLKCRAGEVAADCDLLSNPPSHGAWK
jgi:hypothetical protein